MEGEAEQGSFDRASGVGGSDVAPVLDISPFRARADVWMEKTRHPMWRPQAQTPAMLFGKLLEPVLLSVYNERHPNADVVPVPEAIWHPNGVQYAHLDGQGREGLWEAKVARFEGDWKHGVPSYYLAQVQPYLAITGADWIDFSVYMPNDPERYREYRVYADPAEQVDIESEVMSFWGDVLAGEYPGQLPTVIRYPAPTVDEYAPADASDTFAVRRYQQLQEQIAQLEDQKKLLREVLEEKIGPYPGLRGRGFRVDFKAAAPAQSTSWESVANTMRNGFALLRRFLKDPDPEIAQYLDPAWWDTIVGLYTDTAKPTRPFRVYEVKT